MHDDQHRSGSGRATSASRACAAGCTPTRSSWRWSAASCCVRSRRPGPASPRWSAALIYSLTVCGLFGISALYHRRVWSPRGLPGDAPARPLDDLHLHRRHLHAVLRAAARRADRATVHPGHRLGRGAGRRRDEAGLAARAALGLRAALHRAGLGRGRRAARRSCTAAASPCWCCSLVGGVAYTVGAVFYALRRPNPWPTVFGHHEFFHACTLVAAICHHVAIYFALFA